ncbi:hypothetical protein DFQ28_008178 [Apophysomyces sp. BC1034]|nr:hypothetical protein DFQ30_007892 [Apophysomyces sp. BC1015]KAG0175815.1 hypothetical protein DFQ29_006980 [Apophysomyces sp. BC1021]KAG0186205.1 hypothetical protein DFQ28_008178 [Apophysomyces sp. BC1034]
MSKLGYPLSRSLLTSASYSSTEEEVDIDEDPVDTGAIRCVCNSSDDDGFTIQCERCLVWQHAFCVKIDHSNIPDHYLCDKCEKKFPDLRRSLELQKHRKDIFLENDPQNIFQPATYEKKRRYSLIDPVIPLKRKEDRPKGRSFSRDKPQFPDIHNRPRDEQRPAQPVRQASKKPKLSKRISIPKRTLRELDSDDDFPHGFSKARLYHGSKEFDATTKNIIKSKFVRQIFKEARERWSQLGKWKGPPWRDDQPARGLEGARIKDTSPFVVMDKTMLLPSIPKTSVHPLSKTLHRTSSLTRNAPGVRKAVFADIHIPINRYLMEANGEVILKSEYKFDSKNKYVVLGTQRAHVLFYPTLDLCIDGRQIGSETRFIRRSCNPNAELRSIVLPHAKDDQTIHLGVFTCSDVEKGEEITIGWNWQRGHIAWKKNMEWHGRNPSADDEHQVIDEEEEREKRKALQDMLDMFYVEFGDCACDDRSRCFIEYLKKELKDEKKEIPWSGAEPVRKKMARRSISKSVVPSSRTNAGSSRQLIEGDTPKTLSLQGKPMHNGFHESHDMDMSCVEQKRSSVTEEHRGIPKPVSSHSREIVVSGTNTKSNTNEKAYPNSPTLSVEESIDIDVTSTSPGVGSPIMPMSISVKDPGSDEELDIVGEIDIGDELPTPAPHPLKGKGTTDDEDLSSLSSLSSLSAFEESGNEISDKEDKDRKANRQARRKIASRRIGSVKSKSKHRDGHISSSNSRFLTEKNIDSSKALPSKLPCKKIWMRNFLLQVVDPISKYPSGDSELSPTKMSIHEDTVQANENHTVGDSVSARDMLERRKQSDHSVLIKARSASPVVEELKTTKLPATCSNDPAQGPSLTSEPVQRAAPCEDFDVDDGELSDASSASTIPLENDDRATSLTISTVPFEKYETFVSDDVGQFKRFTSAESDLLKPMETGDSIVDDNILTEQNPAVQVEYTCNVVNMPTATTRESHSPELISETQTCLAESRTQGNEDKKDDKLSSVKSEDTQFCYADLGIKASNLSREEDQQEIMDKNEEKVECIKHVQYEDADPMHEALEEVKPTKIKLSIQEYLMRRSVTHESNPENSLQPPTTDDHTIAEENDVANPPIKPVPAAVQEQTKPYTDHKSAAI